MKRNAYTIAALAALVLLAMVPAHAQQTSAKVNVPFSFYVEEVKMPAGEYLVNSPMEKAIVIRQTDGRFVMTSIVNAGPSANTNAPAKLVFRRYGVTYFLAEAWMPNSDHGLQFFASKTEIEMARNTPQQTVQVAMARVK